MVIKTSAYTGDSSLYRNTYQHINYSAVPVILLAITNCKENRVYLNNVCWLPMLKFLTEFLFSRRICTLLTQELRAFSVLKR